MSSAAHDPSPQERWHKQKVVLTGESSLYNRSDVAHLIKQGGGEVSTVVDRETTMLVVGTTPGTAKMKNADKFGTLQVTAEAFASTLPSYLVTDAEEGKRKKKEKRKHTSDSRDEPQSETFPPAVTGLSNSEKIRRYIRDNASDTCLPYSEAPAHFQRAMDNVQWPELLSAIVPKDETMVVVLSKDTEQNEPIIKESIGKFAEAVLSAEEMTNGYVGASLRTLKSPAYPPRLDRPVAVTGMMLAPGAPPTSPAHLPTRPTAPPAHPTSILPCCHRCRQSKEDVSLSGGGRGAAVRTTPRLAMGGRPLPFDAGRARDAQVLLRGRSHTLQHYLSVRRRDCVGRQGWGGRLIPCPLRLVADPGAMVSSSHPHPPTTHPGQGHWAGLIVVLPGSEKYQRREGFAEGARSRPRGTPGNKKRLFFLCPKGCGGLVAVSGGIECGNQLCGGKQRGGR